MALIDAGGKPVRTRYAIPSMFRRFGLLALVFAAACSSSENRASSGGPPGPDSGPIDPGTDGGTTDNPDVDAGEEGGISVASGKLTVLSLNLHCLKTQGTAYPTNEARLEAIAKAAADENVDVILAQEVCTSKTTQQDARAMLTAALDKATNATWSSVAALAHDAWVGTPDEASEHVAIFSKHKLSQATENAHRAQSALRRITLGATVAAPLVTAQGATLPVRMYTVHLDHMDANARAMQAREVAGFALLEADEMVKIDATDGGVLLPILVAGDFNAQSGAEAPKAMLDYGFVEASGSATTTRIDHVFLHRSAFLSPTDTKILFEGAGAVSDHPGVLVRLTAAPAKTSRLTRIKAEGTFANPLTIRGDKAPLSWEKGWPAYVRAGGSVFVTSELPAGSFAYKFLQNDTIWATGANVNGTGQTDNSSKPSF